MSLNHYRCVYCDATKSVTESDIIPYGITHVKLKYKCVCQQHNEFIANSYENDILRELDILRGFSNIHGRKSKKDITYKVTVTFNNTCSFQVPKFHGIAYMFWENPQIIALDGCAAKVSIEDSSSRAPITSIKVNYDCATGMLETLYSQKMMKLVAKIAYEYYCKENTIMGFDANGSFTRIVTYILNPNCSDDQIVQIIDDKTFYDRFRPIVPIGSHALFCVKRASGMRCVVFLLWGVIAYVVQVEKTRLITLADKYGDLVLFPAYGEIFKQSFSSIASDFVFSSSSFPSPSFSKYVIDGISFLINHKIVDTQAMKIEAERIKRIVLDNQRDSGDKFFCLALCSDPGVGWICFLFIKLYQQRNEYSPDISFESNIQKIFGNNPVVKMSMKEYVQYACSMGCDAFLAELKNALVYIDSILK